MRNRTGGAAFGTAVFGAIIYGLLPHTDIRELMHAAQTQVSSEVLRAFRVEFVALAVISGLTALNAMRVPKIKL